MLNSSSSVAGNRSARFCCDGSNGLRRGSIQHSDRLRAWRQRSRCDLADADLAFREQRLSARPAVRDQFHRSAGPRRRYRRASQPLLDAGPDPRTDGVHRRRQGQDRRAESRARRAFARRLRDARICRRQSGKRRRGGARRHAQSRRLRDRCDARQRVQRPRPVPQKSRCRRQRSHGGRAVPDAAQRRLRPLRAARRRDRVRQAGHAAQRDVGRTGAEGRDQRSARPRRSSRDGARPGGLPADLQVHHRPRADAHRDRAGGGGDAERPRHRRRRRARRPTARSKARRSKSTRSPPRPASGRAPRC